MKIDNSDNLFGMDEFKTGKNYNSEEFSPVKSSVEKSEKLELKSAVEHFETINNEIFHDLKCGLIHGQMFWYEKEEVMQGFLDKEYDVLVATTVIEVGIDVPNASVMLIENSERFGLSQLHQLRGRVGRSDQQSYCLLSTKDNFKYQFSKKSKI